MIILASSSPRRQELMSLVTKEYIVVPSNADEETDIKDPKEMVRFLAEKKAWDVSQSYPHDAVIGADTIVFAKGEILGKPKDRADARRMIELLNDSEHTVYTGVCVVYDGQGITGVCGTDVFFGNIRATELDAYIDTEDIMDKAGAYAIQGAAAKFIYGIEGCYFNVMGLPVRMLYRMLRVMDVCLQP